MEKKIPIKYLKLVGTKQRMRGGLFSRKRYESAKTYDIVGFRLCAAQIVNFKEGWEHPTFELLVITDGMRAPKWAGPFPIREIKVKNNNWKNFKSVA